MRSKKYFYILSLALIIFAISAVISHKKINYYATHQEQVIVIATPPPAGEGNLPPPGIAPDASQTAPRPPAPPDKNIGTLEPKPGVVAKKNCVVTPDYVSKRGELGLVVNRTYDKKENPQGFAKKVDDFRRLNGIPLPLIISEAKLKSSDVVYDNCKPACSGVARMVFASRVVGKKNLEVLNRKGGFTQIPLYESGIEVLRIDELSKKGIPFKTWLVPAGDSPLAILGNDIYFDLDINGLSLQVTPKGDWKVVVTPKNLAVIETTTPLSQPGCTSDEQCLMAKNPLRVFKAPHVCSPVVKHAADEPAQHSKDND